MEYDKVVYESSIDELLTELFRVSGSRERRLKSQLDYANRGVFKIAIGNIRYMAVFNELVRRDVFTGVVYVTVSPLNQFSSFSLYKISSKYLDTIKQRIEIELL